MSENLHEQNTEAMPKAELVPEANEAPKVEVKTKGVNKTNVEAINKINALQINESLILPRDEWEMKTKPGMNVLRRRTGRVFLVQTLKDNSGWKITALSA